VMRNGYRREAESEESAKQRCEPMDKNRIRGASAGRAGNVSRGPYRSTARSVDPAVVLTMGDLPRSVHRELGLRIVLMKAMPSATTNVRSAKTETVRGLH
jgi:hypothetical protein